MRRFLRILTAGILLLLIYEGMVLYTNDKQFSAENTKLMMILVVLGLAAAAYQYVIYRVSAKKQVPFFNESDQLLRDPNIIFYYEPVSPL